MIQIGQTINKEFIDEIQWKVQERAYEEHWCSKNFCQHYSADGDETGDFYESMQHTTKEHGYIWERDHEYEEVTSKLEECITYRLEEEQFYRAEQDDGTTQWEHHGAFKPVSVTAENIDAIEQCLRDAANDITWMIAESWQLFLQTKNPCCWNGEPPKERYGKDWIEDPETRVILIGEQHKQYPISDEVIERCIEKGHTLRKSRYGNDITEYDAEGNEYW